MPSRTTKFVAAIFASVLASTHLTTASHGATPISDNCLAAPNGQSPEGLHWYYRIDRATKRHCWYLGEARQSATPIVATPAQQGPRQSREAVDSSLSDAHAEFSQELRVQKPHRTVSPLGMTGPAQTGPMFDSRRLDQPGPADPSETATDDGSTNASIKAPLPSGEPMLTGGPVIVSDASSDLPSYSNESNDPRPLSYSMPMGLAALMGAILLAGIIASTFFRFATMPRRATTQVRNRRRVNWESNSDTRNMAAYARAGARPTNRPRQLHEGRRPSDSIAQRRRPA